ncbi:MAG: hypothetical protein ABR915_01025 [Thermoguttaceae bacterium]|jgi:hypothetical protein
MNSVKWLSLIVVVALVLGLGAYAVADDAAKTVTGKSSCGGCTGVAASCCVLLTDKDGGRWVLSGDSESLKAAFKVRSSGKTMTATLAGKPVSKKSSDGKEYKEVKVSEVSIAKSS